MLEYMLYSFLFVFTLFFYAFDDVWMKFRENIQEYELIV